MGRSAPSKRQADGLKLDDPGVAMLARALREVPDEAVLLVCSGDVPGVGHDALRLILDVREADDAVAQTIPLSLEGSAAIDAGRRSSLTHAALWPRAHLGKDFTQQCLARAGLILSAGGRVLCAVRKQKGAEGIADFMGELFGNVEVLDRSKGYRLLESVVDDELNREAAQELVDRRYAIEDEALQGVKLVAAPGVFSRRELDAGTRALIEHAAGLSAPVKRVIDVGCGVGPLVLWALQHAPEARALAVDTNLLAVELCRQNAERNGLADRITVLARDGLPDPSEVPDFAGRTDLALINPPTHADAEALQALLSPLPAYLAESGRALAVVNRPGTVTGVLQGLGAQVQAHSTGAFTVLEARWSADR